MSNIEAQLRVSNGQPQRIKVVGFAAETQRNCVDNPLKSPVC